MIIQHNISALTAQRNLGMNNAGVNKNLEKLASGYQVNRAGDDAAGLAISEKMRGQIRGLGMAEQNVSHAINLIQTAEGALQESHALLQRMRELAVQSANGTYDTAVDRVALDREFQRLKDEVDRISVSTEYNGMKLFEKAEARVQMAAAEYNTDFDGQPGFVAPGYSSYSHSLGANTFSAEFVIDFQIAMDGTVDFRLVSQATNNVNITISGSQVLVTNKSDSSKYLEMQLSASFFQGYAGGYVRFYDVQDGNSGQALFLPLTGQQYKWEMRDTAFALQIGANGTQDQNSSLQMQEVDSAQLGIDAATVGDQDDANTAITSLEGAINQVSAFRAELGAMQNRLEHTLNNLGTTRENLTAAEATIRDTDMAKEMMEYTKQSILVQAAQAMLAQAQSLPQGVLSLLR